MYLSGFPLAFFNRKCHEYTNKFLSCFKKIRAFVATKFAASHFKQKKHEQNIFRRRKNLRLPRRSS